FQDGMEYPSVPHCLPLKEGICPIMIQDNLPESVYQEGQLEHPAIDGLMLSLDERLYGSFLEITDSNGVERFETDKERRSRMWWKKPIPVKYFHNKN
ncbi:MAG: hypothetical protein ABL856_07240, partial [Gallionella sp.]